MAERVSVLVKFPPEMLARIEAKAAQTGANRMTTILALIERGLEPPRTLGAIMDTTLMARPVGKTPSERHPLVEAVSFGPQRPKAGSLLKGAKK